MFGRFIKRTSIGLLASAMIVGGAGASFAAPAMRDLSPEATSGIVKVQMRRHDRHGGRHHFQRRGSHYYYNGHRGYRGYRRGYRQYNGYWFPPAAFVAGAIIGGAASSVVVGSGSSHVAWCQSHYRSYRASDDTYQPYNGPRRRCVSP